MRRVHLVLCPKVLTSCRTMRPFDQSLKDRLFR